MIFKDNVANYQNAKNNLQKKNRREKKWKAYGGNTEPELKSLKRKMAQITLKTLKQKFQYNHSRGG